MIIKTNFAHFFVTRWDFVGRLVAEIFGFLQLLFVCFYARFLICTLGATPKLLGPKPKPPDFNSIKPFDLIIII